MGDSEKRVDVTYGNDLAESDVVFFGDPDRWKLIGKAWSKREGWMKSTKVLACKDGSSVLQVTTQLRNPDGSWAVAEAITHVPCVIE